MKIVLLSGGSGKRLWPLSNEVRSKQFLKLLCDREGAHESMVQRVYRQIVQAGIDAEIVVATSSTQVEAIRGQLAQRCGYRLEAEVAGCKVEFLVVSGVVGDVHLAVAPSFGAVGIVHYGCVVIQSRGAAFEYRCHYHHAALTGQLRVEACGIAAGNFSQVA